MKYVSQMSTFTHFGSNHSLGEVFANNRPNVIISFPISWVNATWKFLVQKPNFYVLMEIKVHKTDLRKFVEVVHWPNRLFLYTLRWNRLGTPPPFHKHLQTYTLGVHLLSQYHSDCSIKTGFIAYNFAEKIVAAVSISMAQFDSGED